MATDESSPHAANATHSVSGFTYGSGSIARSDCLVQQSWHTFCGEAPSGYATPDPGQDNYHVDEVCHKTLRDKLRPRPQHDLLPSTSFLDLCVQAYFANFQPIFPIIHAPSFRPHAQNGLLLLSICSIGSLFLGFPRATAQGISMYERLNKAILSSWEAFIVHRGISNHIAIQASVIGQIFALLMGRPKDLAQLEIFHGSLVVSARRMKLHQLSESTDNIAQLSGQELEATWKRWVRREEGRRTLHAIFLQDAEVARLFHVNPIMRQGMDQLPPTCSKEAFAARDAVSWKTVMLLQAVPHSISPPQTAPGVGPNRVQNFPTVLNEFELCVILERVGAAVSESRGPNFPPAQPPLGCQQILTTWYETYQGTGIFKTQESSLMMLWHSICMLLYMDLDMLECAVGREGYEGKQKHHPAARTWAKSLEARKCIAHAILVQRQFEQMQMGTEAPIHAPMCLYRCGITWYCYMQFGSRGQVVESDAMDMPELELLRIDGKTALIEELEGHVGRSAEGFLLKIVNLLRRITHWKVADSLASTLLSIIEECKDIF
ncbi:hypothetical protein GQ53DRAFT_707725 [Thozetella sp. PMI_491]|nr:hypothetical protein GQ53DRAFT_707725 [Thozetella sp. PMI_491]